MTFALNASTDAEERRLVRRLKREAAAGRKVIARGGRPPNREERLRAKSTHMKGLHAERKRARSCINNASHAAPRINPRTGKAYSRCESCRAVHRKTW